MNLKLVKLEKKYQRHLNEMIEEWYAAGEELEADPGSTDLIYTGNIHTSAAFG